MAHSKGGAEALKIERLIKGGLTGTSYYIARAADVSPSYTYKILQILCHRKIVRKLVVNDKYIYEAAKK
jgi:hypothetical protein